MAIDPNVLQTVLHTPESRDVAESPMVTAVILSDPANAMDLVPALEQPDTIESTNARRILCQFGAEAVPYLMKSLRNSGLNARRDGIEIFWSMLLGENKWAVRDTLNQIATDLFVLLDDKRPLPDRMPAYVERDFRGRVCDLTLIVVQQLIDSGYDQSEFRSLDDKGRDEYIARLKDRGFGLAIT